MKRAKLHRSHMKQTITMKMDIIRNQKQHIVDILDEYVSDIIQCVDKGIDWDSGDHVAGQYQDVMAILNKTSTQLEELATKMLEVMSEDEDESSQTNESQEVENGDETESLTETSTNHPSCSSAQGMVSVSQCQRDDAAVITPKPSVSLASSPSPENIVKSSPDTSLNVSSVPYSSYSESVSFPSQTTPTQPVVSLSSQTTLTQSATSSPLPSQAFYASLPLNVDNTSMQSMSHPFIHAVNHPPPFIANLNQSAVTKMNPVELYQGQPLTMTQCPVPLQSQRCVSLHQPSTLSPQLFMPSSIAPTFQHMQQPPVAFTPRLPPPPRLPLLMLSQRQIIPLSVQGSQFTNLTQTTSIPHNPPQPSLSSLPSSIQPSLFSLPSSIKPSLSSLPASMQPSLSSLPSSIQPSLSSMLSSVLPDSLRHQSAMQNLTSDNQPWPHSFPTKTTQARMNTTLEHLSGDYDHDDVSCAFTNSGALNPNSKPFVPLPEESGIDTDKENLELAVRSLMSDCCENSSVISNNQKTEASFMTKSSSGALNPNSTPFSPQHSEESIMNTDKENQLIFTTKSNKVPQVGIDKDSILCGMVLDPDNPWSFHVQFGEELEQMIKDIREHILKNIKICETPVTRGMFCLAKFSEDGEYYRARVMDIEGCFVNVQYVDYGNTGKVSPCDLQPLPSSLSTRPVMAVWCALAGAAPTNSENMWTETAILRFQQMVDNQNVQIRVVQPSPDNGDSCSVPHLVNIIFKMAVKSSSSDSTPTYKPESMSRILIREKMAKAIGAKDQIAILMKLNKPQTENRASDKLKGLDSLFSLMKSSSSSLKSEGVVPHKKMEPLCFTNVKRTNTKVENLKSRLTLTAETTMTCSLEKEVIPTSEQMDSFNLSCVVEEKLLDLKNSLECNDIFEGNRRGVESVMQNVLMNRGMENEGSMDEESSACDDELEFPILVSEILNPNNFFAHPITKEAAQTLTNLEESLAIFVQCEISDGSNLADFTPRKFRLCCTQFSKANNQFCRGLVLDLQGEKVLVFAMDYGHYEWQSCSKLRPLPCEYINLPPLVLWCSLSYTQPCSPAKDVQTDNHWSWNAVEKFKTLVGKDKVLNAVCTKSSVAKCDESFCFEILPVYLLDRSLSGDEVCLNHELIHRGLASVRKQADIERPGMCEDDDDGYLKDEEEFEGWNPMNEDFESIRNSYRVDVEDPGVALVGYKPGDVGREGRKVCVFYNRKEGCFRGDRCTFLHIKVDDTGLSYDKLPVIQFDYDQSNLLPKTDTCVALTVSTIFSPQLFYVTFPWPGLTLGQITSDLAAVQQSRSKETLQTLMDSLQVFYRGSIYDGDLTLKASGQALAAKVKNSWLRAKVIDVDPENAQIQIMCVDFGDIYWVNEKSVRDLELRFLHLPPQAVECCLDGVMSHENNALSAWLWEDDAINIFADLVRGKSLIGIVKHRFASGRILLSLIDTSNPDQELDIGRELTKAFHSRLGISPPRTSVHPELHKKTDEISSGASESEGGMKYYPG